jgi:hypothetical protein
MELDMVSEWVGDLFSKTWYPTIFSNSALLPLSSTFIKHTTETNKSSKPPSIDSVSSHHTNLPSTSST